MRMPCFQRRLLTQLGCGLLLLRDLELSSERQGFVWPPLLARLAGAFLSQKQARSPGPPRPAMPISLKP